MFYWFTLLSHLCTLLLKVLSSTSECSSCLLSLTQYHFYPCAWGKKMHRFFWYSLISTYLILSIIKITMCYRIVKVITAVFSWYLSLAFYFCDETRWPKTNWEENALFGLHIHITVYHWRKLRQELRQGKNLEAWANRGHGGARIADLVHWACLAGFL